MRLLCTATLFWGLLLGGCSLGDLYGTGAPATPAQAASPASPETEAARLLRWRQLWAEARQKLIAARAEAVATRRPVPPQVAAEADEIATRRIDAPTGQAQIEELQDAVEDALRVAELLAVG